MARARAFGSAQSPPSIAVALREVAINRRVPLFHLAEGGLQVFLLHADNRHQQLRVTADRPELVEHGLERQEELVVGQQVVRANDNAVTCGNLRASPSLGTVPPIASVSRNGRGLLHADVVQTQSSQDLHETTKQAHATRS